MPAKKKAASPRSKPKLPKAVVRSVAVLVSDRNRSREWYTGTLGLDLVHDMDHWITVGRKGEGALLHLCQTSDWMGKEELETGNQGISILLSGDFEAACAALEANGVKFVQPVTKEEWGTYATIVDPDGNELTLGSAE